TIGVRYLDRQSSGDLRAPWFRRPSKAREPVGRMENMNCEGRGKLCTLVERSGRLTTHENASAAPALSAFRPQGAMGIAVVAQYLLGTCGRGWAGLVDVLPQQVPQISEAARLLRIVLRCFSAHFYADESGFPERMVSSAPVFPYSDD